jgi:hypothetical protein
MSAKITCYTMRHMTTDVTEVFMTLPVYMQTGKDEREYTETMHFLLYKIILKHSLIRTPTIRHCEIREKTRSSAASYQENGHRKRP